MITILWNCIQFTKNGIEQSSIISSNFSGNLCTQTVPSYTDATYFHAFGFEKIHEFDHILRDYVCVHQSGNRVLVVGQTTPIDRANITVFHFCPNDGGVAHPTCIEKILRK